MAKQSSLFNFFAKSPPPVSKTKSNQSPVEADVPSDKSNTSPKEEAKVSKKTTSKPAKAQVKTGHAKLFGEKAVAAKQRYSDSISHPYRDNPLCYYSNLSSSVVFVVQS